MHLLAVLVALVWVIVYCHTASPCVAKADDAFTECSASLVASDDSLGTPLDAADTRVGTRLMTTSSSTTTYAWCMTGVGAPSNYSVGKALPMASNVKLADLALCSRLCIASTSSAMTYYWTLTDNGTCYCLPTAYYRLPNPMTFLERRVLRDCTVATPMFVTSFTVCEPAPTPAVTVATTTVATATVATTLAVAAMTPRPAVASSDVSDRGSMIRDGLEVTDAPAQYVCGAGCMLKGACCIPTPPTTAPPHTPIGPPQHPDDKDEYHLAIWIPIVVIIALAVVAMLVWAYWLRPRLEHLRRPDGEEARLRLRADGCVRSEEEASSMADALLRQYTMNNASGGGRSYNAKGAAYPPTHLTRYDDPYRSRGGWDTQSTLSTSTTLSSLMGDVGVGGDEPCCPSCHDGLVGCHYTTSLGCGHKYHSACLRRLLTQQLMCYSTLTCAACGEGVLGSPDDASEHEDRSSLDVPLFGAETVHTMGRRGSLLVAREGGSTGLTNKWEGAPNPTNATATSDGPRFVKNTSNNDSFETPFLMSGPSHPGSRNKVPTGPSINFTDDDDGSDAAGDVEMGVMRNALP